jgi:ankyrin repeat protein
METVVRILQRSDTNVNLQNSEGRTPLMMAVVKNNVEIARKLLDAGADLHLQNKVNTYST